MAGKSGFRAWLAGTSRSAPFTEAGKLYHDHTHSCRVLGMLPFCWREGHRNVDDGALETDFRFPWGGKEEFELPLSPGRGSDYEATHIAVITILAVHVFNIESCARDLCIDNPRGEAGLTGPGAAIRVGGELKLAVARVDKVVVFKLDGGDRAAVSSFEVPDCCAIASVFRGAGSLVAVASHTSGWRIYDVATQDLLYSKPLTDALTLEFSIPDGGGLLLAGGSASGEVNIWRFPDRAPSSPSWKVTVERFVEHDVERVMHGTFVGAPSAPDLLIATRLQISVVSVPDAEVLSTCDNACECSRGVDCQSPCMIALEMQGSPVVARACGTETGMVMLRNAATSELLARNVDLHPDGVITSLVTFEHQGAQFVAVGTVSTRITLWQLETGGMVKSAKKG
jgi:hypothetical protein